MHIWKDPEAEDFDPKFYGETTPATVLRIWAGRSWGFAGKVQLHPIEKRGNKWRPVRRLCRPAQFEGIYQRENILKSRLTQVC